jgi:type I restriction enzyme S subunit
VSATERNITADGLKNSAAELLPVGSLIVCTRATVGACCINSVPMTTNQDFKSLIPNKLTDVRYVYHALIGRKKDLIRLANGSTFLEVTKPDFKSLEIAIPAPKEQSLIADILDGETSEIALLEDKIDSLRKQKHGLMQKLLTCDWQLGEQFQ